jgi:hypothetical protein
MENVFHFHFVAMVWLIKIMKNVMDQLTVKQQESLVNVHVPLGIHQMEMDNV